MIFVVGSRGGGRALSDGRFPVGGSHGEFADVLVRMENDDVHFGHVQAHQRHRGAEADRQTHRRYLNLKAAHAEKSKNQFQLKN